MRTLAALLGAALVSSAALAQTKWDMPTPYSDGEFHTINVRQFAEAVAKASAGQLNLNVHSNGSLIKHPDMLRAVSTGQVSIAEFLLGQFGNEEPVFNADNVPFLAAIMQQPRWRSGGSPSSAVSGLSVGWVKIA